MVDSETYDLAALGHELDRNSKPARFTLIFLPCLMVALSLLLALAFLGRILSGTLDSAGWAGLLIVWGFTCFFWLQNRWNIPWQSKRAAISISLSPLGVSIRYPEGILRQFLWSDPATAFRLVDLTSLAPHRKKTLSTYFFISDGERLSAIPADAYGRILEQARSSGIVRPAKPRGSLFFPGMVSGTAWSVLGKPPSHPL